MSLRNGIALLVLVVIATVAATAYREYLVFDATAGLMIAQHAFADGPNSSPAIDPVETVFPVLERQPVVAEKPAAGEPVEQRQSEPRVLVMLKSRAHILTVYSGLGRPEGQQFKVATHDGQVLGERLSMADFQDLYPELYDFYRKSYAEAWAGLELDGSTTEASGR